MMSPKALGVLLGALLLGAAGQLLMKMALDNFKQSHGQIQGLGMLFSALLQIGVLIGFFCYAASSVLYIKLLADLPVSQLYPMVALNYVFVTILAKLILHEQVPVLRVIGLATIICGVITVAMSYTPAQGSTDVMVNPPVEHPAK